MRAALPFVAQSLESMDRCTTIGTPSWLSQPGDEAEELDEPPEFRKQNRDRSAFQKATVRRPSEQASLLTRAIQSQSDDDTHDDHHSILADALRRRSMASNASVASTADLTSDTGLTSPSRTNTPSPPPPEMAMLRLNNGIVPKPRDGAVSHVKFAGAPVVGPKIAQDAPRKRSIQFACAAQPNAPARSVPMAKTPSAQETTRRPCIKFACQARPASTQNTPPKGSLTVTTPSALSSLVEAESSNRRSLPKSATSSPRSSTPKKLPSKTTSSRPKFLGADSVDLAKEGSQFHVFASEIPREDDWIRQENPSVQPKLTINDTLSKENTIRRLGVEAEEEAEAEEEENDVTAIDDDDLEGQDDDDLGDVDEDDDVEDSDGDELDYGVGDGYSTDEETGFADSDEEEDDDENMILWTPSSRRTIRPSDVPLIRQPSVPEVLSDSSTSTGSANRRGRSVKARRIKLQDDTPDLPDSTDFVCGTLDEDRPLEEAFMTSLAARREKKLRAIPQDIDPSFPTSDPENEDEEELYNPVHHSSDEEQWMPGKMEDIHHDQRPAQRRRKSDAASPRRYHSPPPKRLRSPAPKPRVRSPKPLFDRHSPRRLRSPAPKIVITPTGSPNHGAHTNFNLAGRPGLVHTKSLPRPAAFFTHMKHAKCPKANHGPDDAHVRGAIDIVKGLEKKRQRRREKFHQKYVDRARRGQIPERKPMPGRGAERMKELGLLMAGKKDQGNYVLSI
ncbi:hypothetical protein S40288_01051 [Stachybotrys chartarum IBT 40288]|nr:hypothetical protein S40288_01051 [Stachybotrys chartarum IBT 40288]